MFWHNCCNIIFSRGSKRIDLAESVQRNIRPEPLLGRADREKEKLEEELSLG